MTVVFFNHYNYRSQNESLLLYWSGKYIVHCSAIKKAHLRAQTDHEVSCDVCRRKENTLERRLRSSQEKKGK